MGHHELKQCCAMLIRWFSIENGPKLVVYTHRCHQTWPENLLMNVGFLKETSTRNDYKYL